MPWKWGYGQLGAGVVGAGKQTQVVFWKSCLSFNQGAIIALACFSVHLCSGGVSWWPLLSSSMQASP